jgi:hypothetical protein
LSGEYALTSDEEAALQRLIQGLLVQTEILNLVVVHLVAQTANQAEDPADALRGLSNALNAAIDLLPFGRGGATGNLYIEAYREEVDEIIQAALKLADTSN